MIRAECINLGGVFKAPASAAQEGELSLLLPPPGRGEWLGSTGVELRCLTAVPFRVAAGAAVRAQYRR